KIESTAPTRPPRPFVRRHAVPLVAAALLLLALGISYWVFVKPDPSPNSGTQEQEVEFKAGVWHDLLRQPPIALHWPSKNAWWEIKGPSKELWMHCDDVGLLALGNVHKPFQLKLTLHQTPWVGGVGLFVGYKKEKLAARYQFIQLQPFQGGFREPVALV